MGQNNVIRAYGNDQGHKVVCIVAYYTYYTVIVWVSEIPVPGNETT